MTGAGRPDVLDHGWREKGTDTMHPTAAAAIAAHYAAHPKGDGETVYLLLHIDAYRGTPEAPVPLYFRRRSRDKRYGYVRAYAVEATNLRYPPTEWRTLAGAEKALDGLRSPYTPDEIPWAIVTITK